MDNESQVNRAYSADRNALAAYIESNRTKLLTYIQRNMSQSLSRKVEPADILQETTISALNSVADIKPTSRDPYHWLCHLAERRIIDAFRRHFGVQKRAAAQEVGLHDVLTASRSGTLIDIIAADATTPSQALSRHQGLVSLSQALQQLPSDQYEALRLRYAESYATQKISEQLGKSDGAVRVMLSRALAKVQRALTQDN